MPKFYIVDDDPAISRLTAAFLERAGHHVLSFIDADAFKAAFEADGSPDDCVLLDLNLSGECGVEVQAWLAKLDASPAIVVITGEVDVPTAVTLMKRGAKDVLIKPFNEQQLLSGVASALARHESTTQPTGAHDQALSTLTPREREVFELVACGDANKQVAFKLGISQRTVEVHRGRVMHKLGVDSIADLVALAIATGVRSAA